MSNPSQFAIRCDDDKVADGESPATGSEIPGQPSAAAAPADNGRAQLKALLASWPTHFANGLSRLGAGLSLLGRWLARLGRRLARLAELRPSPVQKLAILGGLAGLSIFGALAFPGNPIGQACVIAFVPGLCITLGILGTRWYAGHELSQSLAKATQNALYATLHLKKSVRYVDDRLADAQHHLESGSKEGALIEVVRAKTATELSLGTAEQSVRQWESVIVSDAPPPRIITGDGPGALPIERTSRDDDAPGLIAGSVARIEDEYTLIINRGSEHGLAPDMVFAVMADGGDEILDPETGGVIGELPVEKLRVKVVEVQPKFSRAVTFRTYTPAKLQYPALTGLARAGGQTDDAGPFDSIDESITKMLETELGEPVPVREKIGNAKSAGDDTPVRPQVRVNIGDRVRQVP
ncbi:hypothetical protein A9X01_22405 [Mycobacterium asiaticum]|uniref:Uncharacterized protein n=1 Tax=Mycobacterium asiaticum TaxID=1790 RepID=A0A1A3C6X7_MYCAS|nr:hypothetical protein A9X01_22405 [Mycobacterium asiaticum]